MSGVTSCSASPLTVTAVSVASGPDLQPASRVTVTYTTMGLIRIPGVLIGQTTITRALYKCGFEGSGHAIAKTQGKWKLTD